MSDSTQETLAHRLSRMGSSGYIRVGTGEVDAKTAVQSAETPRATSGHVMRVRLVDGNVRLECVCYEPEGAVCRLTCSQGCEEWSEHNHGHKLVDSGECSAVLYLNADDPAEWCDPDDRHPVDLYDGMPITVEWNGDGYEWRPEDDTASRLYATTANMVTEFHDEYGIAIAEPPSDELRELRADLIVEETREVVHELRSNRFELTRVARELADLVYVVYGAAISLGIDLDEAIRRVHQANMTKSGPLEGGKVLKGPDYVAPDMTGVVLGREME